MTRRVAILVALLLLVNLVPQVRTSSPRVRAQAPAGRVLASARGQVAWLDLDAPRPVPLTALTLPAYPADVAAAPGVAFAVASIVAPFGGTGGMGADLVSIDLATGQMTPLLSRQSETESLEMPAIWPDGSGVLYQRSNLLEPLPVPGLAAPQYQSRIEQAGADGSGSSVLIDDGRFPGPSPDGSQIAFVRSTDQGPALFVHGQTDGSDAVVVPAGPFLALAYPRFSPDGRWLAFAAIGAVTPPAGDEGVGGLPVVRASAASVHGFPWEVWIVGADGSELHPVPQVLNDDPSVAWSPDGSQVLVYGGWGGNLVDVSTDDAVLLPYLSGYGSLAWLPD